MTKKISKKTEKYFWKKFQKNILPENPLVIFSETKVKSRLLISCPLRPLCKISSRSSGSGSGILTIFWNLLKKAGSKVHGRFVEAKNNTGEFSPSFWPLMSPSRVKNYKLEVFD